MKRPNLAALAAALSYALFCASAATATITHAKPAHHAAQRASIKTAQKVAQKKPCKAAPRVALKKTSKAAPKVAVKKQAKAAAKVAVKKQAKAAPKVAQKKATKATAKMALKPIAKSAPKLAQKLPAKTGLRIATKVSKPPAKIALKNTVSRVIFKQGPKPTVAGRRLTSVAKQVASKMNTVGWCYAGVCKALSSMGIELTGDAAYEAKDQLITDKRFKLINVKSPQQLAAGDILVHGKNDKHPYGHIAIYIGNDQEASDHIQPLIFKGPYNGTVVFRLQST